MSDRPPKCVHCGMTLLLVTVDEHRCHPSQIAALKSRLAEAEHERDALRAANGPRTGVSESMVDAAVKLLYPVPRPEAWDLSCRERTRVALEAALRAGEVNREG